MKMKNALNENAPFPTGKSAVAAKNHVENHHGGKKQWSGDSNPYSQHQSFTLSTSKSHADSLHKKLTSGGWSHKSETHYD